MIVKVYVGIRLGIFLNDNFLIDLECVDDNENRISNRLVSSLILMEESRNGNTYVETVDIDHDKLSYDWNWDEVREYIVKEGIIKPDDNTKAKLNNKESQNFA